MPAADDDPVVWWLAGDDADALVERLDARAGSEANGGGPPPDTGGPARLGIVDPDERKVRLARRLLAKGEPWRGRSDIWFTPAGFAGRGGKVAFLFPGVEPAFGAAGIDLPALGARLGLDAPRIVDDSVAQQSASIYRLGIFLDRVLRRLGVEPDVVAGHSVGEWSGTVASGMVPLERADELVAGIELDAVELPDVDFAALAAGAEVVEPLVAGFDGVGISHDNSPGQSIICGPPAAVEVALRRLREANILGYTLPFQSGFHTPAIAPMLEGIRHLAGDLPFGPGRVPMWSATVAGPYPSGQGEIVDLHLRHLVEPVRFRPLVERLYHEAGARIFVQVGIGSLTGFVGDTLDGLDHASVQLLTAKRSAVAQVHRALTALWVEGLDVRADALRPEAPREPAPEVGVYTRASGARTQSAAAPYSLVAAGETLAAAAQASQDLLKVLLTRVSPQPARAPVPVASVPSQPEPMMPAPAPVVPDAGGEWPAGKVTLSRWLSLESMPETLDHTLYLQPEGWGDVADLFPIVAMTTQIQLIQDVATGLSGGRPVVEVFGIRNFRWLDLSEPFEVKITVVPKGTDVLSVSLGGFCRANVRVGDYPPAPTHQDEPAGFVNDRPAQHTAQDLWDLRLMFHGPRFRGIDAIGPIGDDGMAGTFTHLDTPGSLLDNLGKLLAYWVIDQGGLGEGALPVGVERISFYGPDPAPGTTVRCEVRILELQRDLVRGDGVLVLPDGRVWGRVEGWASVVFHLDEKMEPLYHRPASNYAVEPQPGGWAVQRERWLTGAGRDLTARRFTNGTERRRYESLNVVEQRRWLIETITVKDTVRHWLADTFGISAYPVEVVPVPDGERRFRVECPLVPDGHDPRVTLSSLPMVPDAIAVTTAIVGDGEYRDIEARQIPEGADPDDAAREAAAVLAERNPGAHVASVPRPPHAVPSTLVDVPDPPPFAVAWTD